MTLLEEPTTDKLLRLILSYDPREVRTKVQTRQKGVYTSVKIYIPTEVRKRRSLAASR